MTLRPELLKRLSPSQKQRNRQLLTIEDMGDRTPSLFLRRLRRRPWRAGFAPSIHKDQSATRQHLPSRRITGHCSRICCPSLQLQRSSLQFKAPSLQPQGPPLQPQQQPPLQRITLKTWHRIIPLLVSQAFRRPGGLLLPPVLLQTEGKLARHTSTAAHVWPIRVFTLNKIVGFLRIKFPGLALVWSYVLCVDCLLLPSAKFLSMCSIDRLFGAACVVMEDDLFVVVCRICSSAFYRCYICSLPCCLSYFLFFQLSVVVFFIYLDGAVV
jgi:hypothetical protein